MKKVNFAILDNKEIMELFGGESFLSTTVRNFICFIIDDCD